MKKGAWIFIGLIVVVLGVLYAFRHSPILAPFLGSGSQQQLVSKVSYACDAGKALTASYYSGAPAPVQAQSQPPVPVGSVSLLLSDGRTFNLPQTISGSGIRYANAGESVVFWSKGNTAFLQEGVGSAAITTFGGCIAQSNLPGQESWNTYASSTMNISVRYPQAYTLDPTHVYQAFGPGKDIHGVALIVPGSMATGTNLGSDSYVAVEEIPGAQSCSPANFLDLPAKQATSSIKTISDNNVTYSVASTTGAAAGQRFEEWAWVLPESSPCTAVRYFVHYGVIENYPKGAVKEFDESALLREFDGIRRSLITG